MMMRNHIFDDQNVVRKVPRSLVVISALCTRSLGIAVEEATEDNNNAYE